MATPTPHPAFVDSNLNTRLALLVSADDTVSDIKEKIAKEHQLCFPQLGNIQVHGVKVKRKGYYYHLSDSMTVQSAFHGVSNWFLSVDASTAGDHSQNLQSCEPVFGNLLTGCGIDNIALVDRVDLASGLCPKRSPNLDETQLPLDVTEQFGKAMARIGEKEVLESKRIEGDRSINNVCEARSADINSRADLGLPIMCSPRDREPEVGKALSTDIEVSCGRKRDNAEDNELLNVRSTGKEKRKRKKGMTELMDNHSDVDNSICENGVDISQQVVASETDACIEGSDQISKGIKTIANEPCPSSSSDTLKRSCSRFQSNNICQRTEIPDELVISKTYDLRSENPIRVLQSSPASKKAKKENNNVDEKLYFNANGVLVSEINEKPATISEQFGDSIKCNFKTALDGLSAEPLENICLSGTSSSSGKKKKKKKTKLKPSNLSSQVDVAILSHSKDDKGHMSILTSEIPMKVTGEADVLDNIPVHFTQDSAVSNFARISAVEMHYGKASDVDVRNLNIDNGERIRDAPEKDVFAIERINNAKDSQITDAKGETDQIDGVTEDVTSSQTCDKRLPLEKCISSGRSEADVIVNEVITSLGLLESKTIDNANHKKKKKRKKSKICDEHTPLKAVIEDGKGNEHDNSSVMLHTRGSCSVPLSQTMSEEVAIASLACGSDQNCGITESITPSMNNENSFPSRKFILPEQNVADLTLKEENFKKINESSDPNKKKKKKKSKSRSGDRLLKSVDEHAMGKQHRNSSAGPNETLNSNVCSEKTMAVEMIFSQNPSEEATNFILSHPRSGMDDTSVDLVEASQSNGATMMEKKDEKLKKKSKKSSAHDKNGSEALALGTLIVKIPEGVVHNDRKDLKKDALDVQPLTSRKTSVKNNSRVNQLERRKSLLTKSGRIFKDASSDTSLDDDLVSHSDATVSTPDNSFSSDHSDNESNANMNLAQNGSYYLEKRLLDGRNIRNTESTSAAKSMTLDRILRSSTRYRKAKKTAIESQLEDTNIQPVDMVPDSQPNL